MERKENALTGEKRPRLDGHVGFGPGPMRRKVILLRFFAYVFYYVVQCALIGAYRGISR